MNTSTKKHLILVFIFLSNSITAADSAASISGNPSTPKASATSIKPQEMPMFELFKAVNAAEDLIDGSDDAELKKHKEECHIKQFQKKPSSWAEIYEQHSGYLQFLLAKLPMFKPTSG